MNNPDSVLNLALALTVALPLGAGFLLSQWEPSSRIQTATRASLWPAALLLIGVAGPMARAIYGTSGGMPLSRALQGYAVLALVIGAVSFLIAYFRKPSAAADPVPAPVASPTGCAHCKTDAPTKTLPTGDVRCTACGFLRASAPAP